MAFNLSGFVIQAADKLRTGFRAKYNLLLNKVIKDTSVDEQGIVKLITHDNSFLELDLKEAFYTKEEINENFVVELATEEDPGIIRIATEEEVIAGEDDDSVVTPYKLWLVLQQTVSGRITIAGENLVAGDLVYLTISEEPVDPEDEGDVPVLIAHKAIATAALTLCMGFIEEDALSGEDTSIKLSGSVNASFEGLIPGQYYYLNADPTVTDRITPIPPTTPGSYQQIVGYAISEVELMMELHRGDLNWTPVYVPIFPELYFEVGKLSTEEIFLPDFLAEYNIKLDENGDPIKQFSNYRFLNLPDWIGIHTVIFDNLSLTGTPAVIGRYKSFFEVTDLKGRDYIQEIIINVIPQTKISNSVLKIEEGIVSVLGKIPGAYQVPEIMDIQISIDGLHDSIYVKLTGGGVSGDEISEEKTIEVVETNSPTIIQFFEDIDGIAGQVGLFRLEVTSFLRENETKTSVSYFTLYDEEYLSRQRFELWNTKTSIKIGDIDISETTTFPHPGYFDPKTIIEGLEHDKITIVLSLAGEVVKTTVYENDPPVEDAEYYVYEEPQEDQLAGVYSIEINIELEEVQVFQARSEFEILEKEPEPEVGLKLVTFKPGTTNYTVIEELPLKGAEYDLPENYSVLFDGLGGRPYKSVESKFYFERNGSFVEIDIEQITGYPQKIVYDKEVVDEKVLIFGLKNSTQISDIHQAPSQVRAIFTTRDENGVINGIRKSDFSFRVALLPEDYSGLAFFHDDTETGAGTLIDSDMPRSGRKYVIPEFPLTWSVRAKTFEGKEFDVVEVWVSRKVAGQYVTRANVIYLNEPVTELPDYETVKTEWEVSLDRVSVKTSSPPIYIDEVGEYRVIFFISIDDVNTGFETQFELINEPVEPPIKDCCACDCDDTEPGTGEYSWELTDW